MVRPRPRVLAVIGGAALLLVLIALILPSLVSVDRFKPDLEAAASKALDMDVRIGGRLGIAIFPRFHLTAERDTVRTRHGTLVGTLKRADLYFAFLPLLKRDLRLTRIDMKEPTLFLGRGPGGKPNVGRPEKLAAVLAALYGVTLSVSNGSIVYADALLGSDLNLRAVSGDSVVNVRPIRMKLFGGDAAASVRADLSGATTRYRVQCALPRFRIEELLATMSAPAAGSGEMAFSADLSLEGETGGELVRSTAGEISLRGERLTLRGTDLDGAISKYESSQHFSLIDVGAVFLVGPLGLAATKGYDFAKLFLGSGEKTAVGVFVSDWRVDHGVAQATDAAFTTPENRIAMKGGLDFVEQSFADLTVAVVNDEGCATLQQTIHGPFEKPEVDKPHILSALVGPVVKLVKTAKDVLPLGPCDAFYEGSVKPPGEKPPGEKPPGEKPSGEKPPAK